MELLDRLAATAGRALDVVGVGEAMVELFADVPLGSAELLQRAYGGDVMNALVGLARAGHAVGFVSRVGDDPFGAALLGAWASEHVDLRHCPLVEGVNGVYFISVAADGEREFSYRRAGSAAAGLAPADVDAVYLATARVVLLSGITQAISASAQAATLTAARAARDAGVVVAYDPNHRARLWVERAAADGAPGQEARIARDAFAELVPFVDLLLVSEPADLAALGSGPADRVLAAVAPGVPLVVRKRGADGCEVRSDGRWIRVAPVVTPSVVDATGAGDAWNAGFLSALLRGGGVTEAAAHANAVASRSLGHRGAIGPAPKAADGAAAARADP